MAKRRRRNVVSVLDAFMRASSDFTAMFPGVVVELNNAKYSAPAKEVVKAYRRIHNRIRRVTPKRTHPASAKKS